MKHRGWITAQQFIDDNYVEKVKRGECEIWDDYPYSHIVNIENKPFNADWPLTATVDKGRDKVFGVQPDYQMTVDWVVTNEEPTS